MKPVAIVKHPGAGVVAYPGEGNPCNGCGMCCMAWVCPMGKRALFGVPPQQAVRGPCPALELEAGRYWCGLVRNAPDPNAAAARRAALGDGSCDTTIRRVREPAVVVIMMED